MEEDEIIRKAMALIGSRTSEKKKRTSAENGKRGGRPKGTPQSEETKAKIRAARLARDAGEPAANAIEETRGSGTGEAKQTGEPDSANGTE